MKNMMKWIAVITFVCSAMGVSAQVKLGHIETQKLIQAMPEMAKARETMEAKQSEIERELTNMQEQFKAKFEEYSKNGKTMSDVIRAAKEQELQELQQRIQSFQQIAMENLEKTQAELMQPIMEKAMNAIKEVGKENGFAYIFDLSQGGILYFADQTEDVLPLVKRKLGLQ